MRRSKYWLAAVPVRLANGARVLSQFNDKHQVNWLLECQSCLSQWSTQAAKASARLDARFCPNCARKFIISLKRQETAAPMSSRDKRRHDRIAKAINVLAAEGYYVRKR